MKTFTALDLQRRSGEIQDLSGGDPVLVTSHGKPRRVLMSVEEYRRLKTAAGEPLPAELSTRWNSVTLDGRVDPLGYDVSDLDTAVDRMIEDVRTGRTREAVAAELEGVRRTMGTRPVR